MELEQQMVIETEWLDENDVFFATRAIGFLITNKFGVTEELRQENSIFVEKTRKNILKHFKDIGIEEVIVANNSYEDCRKGMFALRMNAKKHLNPSNGKLLIYVYYYGYGAMINNSIHAIFEEE